MHPILKKKITAVFCTAITALSSLSSLPAVHSAAKGPHVTVLGDSLGTNYNLQKNDYGYADYIADYLKVGTYSKFAKKRRNNSNAA